MEVNDAELEGFGIRDAHGMSYSFEVLSHQQFSKDEIKDLGSDEWTDKEIQNERLKELQRILYKDSLNQILMWPLSLTPVFKTTQNGEGPCFILQTVEKETIQKKLRDVAIALINEGDNNQKIARISGLPMDEIKSLRTSCGRDS